MNDKEKLKEDIRLGKTKKYLANCVFSEKFVEVNYESKETGFKHTLLMSFKHFNKLFYEFIE